MVDNEAAKKKILIVDDMESIRSMTKAVLKDAGFGNVLTVADGQRAISVIKKTKVDLVICDWNMPDLDGIDVLKAVRESELNEKTPFVMLTANTETELVKESIEIGISGYIAKPFTPVTLQNQVKKILNVGK